METGNIIQVNIPKYNVVFSSWHLSKFSQNNRMDSKISCIFAQIYMAAKAYNVCRSQPVSCISNMKYNVALLQTALPMKTTISNCDNNARYAVKQAINTLICHLITPCLKLGRILLIRIVTKCISPL